MAEQAFFGVMPHLSGGGITLSPDSTGVVVSVAGVNQLLPALKAQFLPWLVQYINNDPAMKSTFNQEAHGGASQHCFLGICVCAGVGGTVKVGITDFSLNSAHAQNGVKAISSSGTSLRMRATITGLTVNIGKAYASTTGCALVGFTCSIEIGAIGHIGSVQFDVSLSPLSSPSTM